MNRDCKFLNPDSSGRYGLARGRLGPVDLVRNRSAARFHLRTFEAGSQGHHPEPDRFAVSG